jgi:hypothetical protein
MIAGITACAAGCPRQCGQHLQHRSVWAIIFPCLVGRITSKVSRAPSVAFTHCTDPLKILESSRYNRIDLPHVDTKRSHSVRQQISCFRTVPRQPTKLRYGQAQIMSHSLSFIFTAANQFREAGFCSSPIPPPLPHSTEHFTRVQIKHVPLLRLKQHNNSTIYWQRRSRSFRWFHCLCPRQGRR